MTEHLADSPAEIPKPPLRWSRPLARPVTLRGGPNLVTLADVRTFLFWRMRTEPRQSSAWQRVTALLLSAARSDEVDVADVTIALEMAASMDEGRQPGAPDAVESVAADKRATPAKADFSKSAVVGDDRTASAAAVTPPATARASFLSKVFR